MAKPTQYATVVPDAGDWAALADYLRALEERVAALEEDTTEPTPEPEPPGEPSPDGMTTGEPLVVLTDDLLDRWRINEARSVECLPANDARWGAAGVSYAVALIMKWQATCYQCNESGDWYRWADGTWHRATDPSKPLPEPSEGAYSVRDGYIVDANGRRFVASGFCLLDRNAHVVISGPDCKPLLDHYPSCNYLHIMPWLVWTIYTWPQEAINLVEWATAKGIICQIGNWWTWPAIPTGDLLRQECEWYADLAARYKDNPRVWFTSCNEPQDVTIGLPAGSITAEHRAVYNAIRGTGSNTIIGLLGFGGWSSDYLQPISEYATMRNVHWDSHFYPWMSGPSGDYNTCVNAVYNIAAGFQWIMSADGVMPCLFGEVGNATDGSHVDDPTGCNVQACMDVAQRDFNGCGMFCAPFWPADTGGQPNADQIADEWAGHGLTPYGKQVQAHYASGAVTATATATDPRAALHDAVAKWRAEHA